MRPNFAASKCSGRRFWRPDKPEEAPKICCRGGGEFFRRQVSHISQRARYFRDIGRLVALTAVGLRREERGGSFDQNTVKRNFFCGVTDVLGLRISGVAGEGNHEPGVEAAAGRLACPGETM